MSYVWSYINSLPLNIGPLNGAVGSFVYGKASLASEAGITLSGVIIADGDSAMPAEAGVTALNTKMLLGANILNPSLATLTAVGVLDALIAIVLESSLSVYFPGVIVVSGAASLASEAVLSGSPVILSLYGKAELETTTGLAAVATALFYSAASSLSVEAEVAPAAGTLKETACVVSCETVVTADPSVFFAPQISLASEGAVTPAGGIIRATGIVLAEVDSGFIVSAVFIAGPPLTLEGEAAASAVASAVFNPMLSLDAVCNVALLSCKGIEGQAELEATAEINSTYTIKTVAAGASLSVTAYLVASPWWITPITQSVVYADVWRAGSGLSSAQSLVYQPVITSYVYMTVIQSIVYGEETR